MYRLVFFLMLFLASCGGSDVAEYRLPVADCSLSSREAYSEEELAGVWNCTTYYYADTTISFKPDNTATAIIEDEGIISGTWSISGCVLELHFDDPGSSDSIIGELQILELTNSYAEFIDSDAETSICRK